MAFNPLFQNLLDNTKPQQTKYTAKTAEDFKQQSVTSNFQVNGNSPMKPAPIKFSPMPTPQPIQQTTPTVGGMIDTFNKNLPSQPMMGQGTIAPMPSINLNQPVAGIPQLPSEVKTPMQDFSESFSANLENRQANDFVPVTQQTVLDLSANIAQGDTIEMIKQKFPELQHLDDQVIKDFSANLAQGDDYDTLIQKYPEINPDVANNPEQRGFSFKQEGKNFLNYASAVGDTIGELGTKAIDESGMITKASEVDDMIAKGEYDKIAPALLINALGNAGKMAVNTPGFFTTIAENPVGTVEALGDAGKMLVDRAINDPKGTLQAFSDYMIENPLDLLFALQGAKSVLKTGEKIVKGGQKIYNTGKVIVKNEQVPVKFNLEKPGAITTPEMAKASNVPMKETVRTTMPAREVIKVKAKQGFENLKRKAQEVLPKKGTQENVIDANATDYTTKAQEVVQKAKDVFKKKPTAEVVTDTPETTGKSTLDKVQPSKKDVIQGERKGIDPIVVAVVKEKPGLFKQVQNGEITEETVADRIIQAKEQKFSESSQIGKTYESMYQSEYKFDGNTILDQSVEKLKSLGISLDDGVKIDSTKYVAESGEKGKIGEALSKIFDIQGKEVSVQELHTLRKSVDKLIKRSEGIDRKNSKAVLEVRSIIDNELKDKIGGWKGLDEISSKKYDEIGQIMSEFFNTKGKFKYDPKTLLTDRNKKKLDILEELIPGVKDEIIMLATHKSYLRSKNTNKPGTYRKSMIKQVASTLGGLAGVTAGNSTVGSILMGMAGTYVGEKVGAYFGDPESFIKSITKDNRGASIIDDIEIGQEISEADKEYLNSLVKEAIKSGKIQKTERIMKKNREENIKKEVKRGIDTLTRKKSMSLPEKTETNLGTKSNPIIAYDKRPNEVIQKETQAKQEFMQSAKKIPLDNFTSDRAKRGELFAEDGTKVSKVIEKQTRPYNPVQAILEDGRTLDLSKNNLYTKSQETPKQSRGLDTLKPSEKQVSISPKVSEQKELMPWDDGYQATIKETPKSQEINLSKMSDDEFMKYQETLDPNNMDPAIEQTIMDEIFRRTNIDNGEMEKTNRFMREIQINDSNTDRVGKVGNKKVVNSDVRESRQRDADKEREKIIERIGEEYGLDQNEAYDKYLELQSKYKYQQTIRDRSTVSPEEALATVRKYFDEDELSVNFLENITTPSGQEAFGRYYNKTIDMINEPHKTTADHESAHAYFDMFTSKDRQTKILDQIKKEQGLTDDLEAEEFLADGFADYVSGKNKMTYGQKIKEFFNDVWEQIKKFFGKKDQVKQFYNDIMNKRREKLNKNFDMKDQSKYQTKSDALTSKSDGMSKFDVNSIKKNQSFKTDEGNFSVRDIEDKPKGRVDMFTVLEDKNGYIVRNAYVPKEMQNKGIATEFYKKINDLSISKTGKPLRSTRERKLITGEKVIELSNDGVRLWDGLVEKGLAKKVGDKNYEMKIPTKELQPLYEEAKKYKSADEFEKKMLLERNQTSVKERKDLSELDTDDLKRAIGVDDYENIPEYIMLYRGIDKDIDFGLRPGDYLTVNKKNAQSFTKGKGRIKKFKVKTNDLMGNEFGYQEVVYNPGKVLDDNMNPKYKQIREEANKTPTVSENKSLSKKGLGGLQRKNLAK